MKKLDENKKPVFVFVGTLKHHVDCIAPCVGKLLEKEELGFDILYCDQTQINETYEKLKEYDRDKYQVIAFDVGFVDSTKRFSISDKGVQPASMIKKRTKRIGDFGIVINISGVYSGSLANQKKKFLRNDNNEKVSKRVDNLIKHTYIALKDIIRLYSKS